MYELTHDLNSFLPLFTAVIVSYAFTVLTMKPSILTEKIRRRGFHLSREYAIDPLEILFVREVMRTNIVFLNTTGSRYTSFRTRLLQSLKLSADSAAKNSKIRRSCESQVRTRKSRQTGKFAAYRRCCSSRTVDPM